MEGTFRMLSSTEVSRMVTINIEMSDLRSPVSEGRLTRKARVSLRTTSRSVHRVPSVTMFFAVAMMMAVAHTTSPKGMINVLDQSLKGLSFAGLSTALSLSSRARDSPHPLVA